VELVFDTGMHRTLMLSQKLSDMNRMVWGRPQPETVKDYDIQVQVRLAGDSANMWRTVAKIQDNYMRKRSHNVAAEVQKTDVSGKGVKAVRIYYGIEQARMFEVRIYGTDGMSKFPHPPEGFGVKKGRLVEVSKTEMKARTRRSMSDT